MALGRRTWLGVTAVGASLLFAASPAPRRVLVLGGTRFVGRHIVVALLASGHQVTLFNRGRTAPGLFPAAEELHGDRNGELEALRGRSWDVVIDTSGTKIEQVHRSAELLASTVTRYVYVSSVAVYGAGAVSEYSENAPLRAPPTTGKRSYGEHKIGCELEVLRCFDARATILRPAALIGPHDPHDRFIRWPLRAREGGDMLVPGRPEDPVPLVDARDLAAWVVHIVETGVTGIYNVAGPLDPMGALIDLCITRAGVPVTPVWVDAAWLRARKLDFDSVPPISESNYQRCSSARAIAEGLCFRGLAASLDDTLAWWDHEQPRQLKAHDSDTLLAERRDHR